MMRVQGYRAALTALLAGLAGCGGGGSDGSAGQGSTPGLSVSDSRLSFTSAVTSRDAPTKTVVITPLTAETRNAAVRARYSQSGIADVQLGRVGDTLELVLTYREPFRVAPATYGDSIRIEACTDDACSAVIEGSQQTIDSSYTVFMPTGADAPRLTVSTTDLDLHALVTDGHAPNTPNIGITYANVPVYPTVQMTVEKSALVDAYYQAEDASGASIRLSLIEPNYLGRGTYVDRITLSACLDEACVNPLPESPITITVRLDVSNTVDGPQGYTVNVLDITANDLAWDAIHSKMYVSTPVLPDGQGAGLIVLDPSTRNVERSIALESIPHALALSDDGQFLYVGYLFLNKVSRFALPALTLDLEIPLGTTIGGSPMMPHDMQVAPGIPRTVAIARTFDQQSADSAACGLVIFDDAVARANASGTTSCNELTEPTISYIQWHGSGGIYASDAYSMPGKMHDVTIDASGIQAVTTVDNVISRRLHYDGGTLYNDVGAILDPASLMVQSEFPTHLAARADLATSDAQTNRFYLLNVYEQRDADDNIIVHYNIAVYDEQNRTRLLEIPIDERWYPRRMVRWGADGLALNSVHLGYEDGQLILINGPAVAPP